MTQTMTADPANHTDPPDKENDPDCPRCGLVIDGPPALSRADNETSICAGCGMGEAMQDAFFGRVTPTDEWAISEMDDDCQTDKALTHSPHRFHDCWGM